MFANKLSPREQLLLTVAGIAFTVLAYYHYRFRPSWNELRGLESETAAARQQLVDLVTPPPPPDDPDRLTKEIAARKDELKKELATEQQHRKRFAANEAQREQLHVEITELAERCGVRLRERKPAEEFRPVRPTAPPVARSASEESTARPSDILELPTGPFLDGEVLARRFNRSLVRMQIDATFTGLHRFLMELDRLSWKVVVVRWDVQTGQLPNGVSGVSPLRANLVVAL